MSLNGHPVLVTGGTGFIGTRVVRALVRRNVRVRILAKDSPSGDTLPVGCCEVHVGDIRDRRSVQRAMRGVRQVCHLAAAVNAWSSDPGLMLDVNVDGTRTVAEAAIEEGVERLIHVSSGSAIEYRGTGVRDESDIVPRRRNLTEYARSKLGAERAIEMAGESGLAWIMVYPTRVFGTGVLDDANAATRILAARLRGRLPLLPGGGKEMANWVFADDVAEGLVRALFHGTPRERYILGGENASLREFFAIAEEIAGVSRLTVPLPHGLARAIAVAEHSRSRVMRDRPRVTRQWYDAIVEDTRLTVRKAQVELGYHPTPLRDALAIVVEWLRHMNLLNGGKRA